MGRQTEERAAIVTRAAKAVVATVNRANEIDRINRNMKWSPLNALVSGIIFEGEVI